jgi:hypothetical protein
MVPGKPLMGACRLLAALGCAVAVWGAEPTPLPEAHAHNDYLHGRPLLDALDNGFCSVEADIWLVEGRLLVAHDRVSVKPERTLEALYLDPLRERIRQNGGCVYAGGPPCTLLIDVKSEAQATWVVLRDVLRNYTNILTAFTPTKTLTNAVTIVLSGNRSPALLAQEQYRYAAVDGNLADLGSGFPPNLVPLISGNWATQFRWRGEGPLAEDERQKLGHFVAQAHEQGRRLRFWGAPDRPAAWQELREAGVDLINSDNLRGLREWLLANPR